MFFTSPQGFPWYQYCPGSKTELMGAKQEHFPLGLLKFLTDLNNFENPWRI